MSSVIVTEGNLVADPHLRLTANGTPVASATLAVTDRTKDTDGAWIDGHTSYYELTVWGSPADIVADTARKAARRPTGRRRRTDRREIHRLGRADQNHHPDHRHPPRPVHPLRPPAEARPTREALTAAR